METNDIEEKLKKVKSGIPSEAETIINGRICYFCEEEIKQEEERRIFKVIIDGKLRDFHKSCYNKYQADKSNIRIKIR